MKRDLSHLGKEEKRGPTDVTPTKPMQALRPSTYSPTEEITKYAPPPKAHPMLKIQAFLNMIPHWVILVMAGATGALLTYFQQTSTASLVAALSSWTLLKPILAGGVTVFLTAVVTLLKAAPWGNAAPSNSKLSAKRASISVPPLAVLMLAGLLAFVVACFGAASVAPSANLAACVATNALAGKSIAQIAITCESDAASVILSLFTSSDPTVRGSSAFGEAVRTKAALEHVDAGSP